MQPSKALSSFSDPQLEAQAQSGLNALVLALLERVGQAIEVRPRKLGTLHVIDDPVLADEAFKSPALFQKNFALIAALGQSRFNLNGERWIQFRDRTQPAYNKGSKPEAIPNIQDIFYHTLRSTTVDNAATLEDVLVRGSLSVFCSALGINLNHTDIVELFPQIRTHAKMLQFFSWYGSKETDVLTERAAWLNQRFTDIVLADPLTTAFIAQAIEGKTPTEFEPAVTDLMQNLFAAIETTVATLSWAVYLLGKNAFMQAALLDEADLPFKARTLTRGFLSETMRCFPPIPFVVRELSTSYHGHGKQYEKGDQVLISVIGLHRHADYWEQPNEFHAARKEFSADAAAPLAFRPFLSGPRVCGGKRLAEIEMMVALSLIVKRWRIQSTPDNIGYDYALALRPRSLEKVQLQTRLA